MIKRRPSRKKCSKGRRRISGRCLKKCSKDEYRSLKSKRCFKRIDIKDNYEYKDFCLGKYDYYCNIIRKYNVLPKNYFVYKILGEGTYGTAFLLCNKSNKKCEKVLKIGKPNIDNTRSDLLKEIKLHEQFYRANLAPKLYKSRWLKKENTYFQILERVDITLGEYLRNKKTKEEINNILLGLYKLLKKMKSKGLVHGDFHPGNIALKQRANKITPYLIDFGFSEKNVSNPELFNIELIQLYRALRFFMKKNSNYDTFKNGVEKIISKNMGRKKLNILKKYNQKQITDELVSYYKQLRI